MCAVKLMVCYQCGRRLEFTRGYIKHPHTGPHTVYRVKPCKHCKEIADAVIDSFTGMNKDPW
jgi:predicted RNA-binding Zn-ribbon protein involved in translation (DUF1610 family)